MGRPENDCVALIRRIRNDTIPEPNSGCLFWLGATWASGYPLVTVKGRAIRLHRWYFAFMRGPLDDSEVVRHKCDNPFCLNIDHMERGSQADNVADMWKRNRRRVRIPAEASLDGNGAEVARRYGVTKEAVYAARKRRGEGYLTRKGAE